MAGWMRFARKSLATPDESMTAMEAWDAAGLELHDAEAKAKKARDPYKRHCG
jgi:hypothetical protein